MRENNIKIPQKGVYDSTTNAWAEAPSINAPESAYKITDGTADDYSFEYKTYNEDGSVTSNYYKIELKLQDDGTEQTSSDIPNFTIGTSESVKWTKLDSAPPAGTQNVIQIKLSSTQTLYYQYEYTTPENYENAPSRIDSSAAAENYTNKTFLNFTAPYGGGAIVNFSNAELGTITSDFYGNNATMGGAIYNDGGGKIGNINGVFINNTANSGAGGAIINFSNSNIGDITGDFINNKATMAGAIYNDANAVIGNIHGDFINNTTTSGAGGAIVNIASGQIGEITGNFINNNATMGGAIYNDTGAVIKKLNGDFVNNTTTSGGGGAIVNNSSAQIGDITGNFINNTANYGGGGAIYNASNAIIGNIQGNFINNSSSGRGGAIYNYDKAQIGNIDGNFINNTSSDFGSAIYNDVNSIIGNVTGNFINNSGSVIYNEGNSRIGDINGSFINNTGRAIYNQNSTIGNITGNFIGNTDTAIYSSSGIIGNITGDFINNSDYSIYNSRGKIGDITGDFINNSGRAVDNNSGTIGNITGDFISNSDRGVSNVLGTIGNISGNFINNSDTVIYNNNGTVGKLNGNFVNNSGTAVYNYSASIDDINGDFISNSNGAVYNNTSTIGNISGNFINNTISPSGNNGEANGGAIYNFSSTIGNITGDFINNSVSGKEAYIYGGAISNRKTSAGSTQTYEAPTIGNIIGNFVNNSASSENFDSFGGAIYNEGNIKSISGIFKGNSASTGGALYNNKESSIGDVNGDFIGNYSTIYGGGAIVNADASTIKSLSGNFTDNIAEYGGGAIYNDQGSKIGKINGNFINNSTKQYGGGAIVNHPSCIIGDIKGNFVDNSAPAGGAIYNTNEIGNLTGDFINNSSSTYGGGAIVNSFSASIGDIIGNFSHNTASGDGSGGAIYNDQNSKIGKITGNFTNNTAISQGGAIVNYSSNIDNINGEFYNNSAAVGGAVYNDNGGTIGNIIGNFSNNSATSYGGGAIVNKSLASIENIIGNFVENSSAGGGGAIYNDDKGSIGDITGNFINNSSSGFGGGAIVNISSATIGKKDADGNIIGGIINSNFIGNYAQSAQEVPLGGAINTSETLNIITDGVTTTFKDNYTLNGSEKDDNAIYVSNTKAAINFRLKNNGKIVMNDNIRGAIDTTTTDSDGNERTTITDAYKVNITGDSLNTTFYLYNDMYLANLSTNNTTLNAVNNLVHAYHVNKFTVNGKTNFVADVDLKNKEMDRFTANSYGTHNGNLNVIGMNILADADPNEKVTAVYFAQPGLKNNVTHGLGELPQSQYQNFEVFTPIFKYNVTYDNKNQYDGKGDGGYFMFARGNSDNPSDAFNPAVLTAPVTTVTASQATLNEVFKYVFEHADAFTQLPASERLTQMEANKYALSTDFNSNLNRIQNELGSLGYEYDNNKATWVRPFTTFEDINLKNGPAVDAITYGTIIGYDGDFKEIRNGWHRLGTAYIGYNGSQLSYAGNDTTVNGGLLGLTETYYKGNFWTAVTASAGASVGETHTMYGKEDYTNLLAGVASKTGYNIEFKEGRYIIQPIMFMSYTFVNTFDFTNAAGVKIDTKPAHSIMLHPNVRFIMNCKNGWQPYAQAGVVWNVMNKAHMTANGVRLPNMRMEPYAEYGLGVQRNWKDKFTAFGQAMIRNGGRTGIAFTAGFRWAIGRDKNHNHEKEQVHKPAKKVIKKASL